MEFHQLEIPDLLEITPSRHSDERGYFSETFRDDWFSEHVTDEKFVQENQSLNRAAGVVRGLHFQSPPSAQGKLVRCLSGMIYDVAADIRLGSPNFGKYAGVTLSADIGNQLWIPAGFLHGFCTLSANTLVSYRITSYYDQRAEHGVAWNDPAIGIVWPDCADPSSLSAKDARQPRLADLPHFFTYGGAAS